MKDLKKTIFILRFSPLFYSQDPAEADKLLKIQRELDETKIILVSVLVQPCHDSFILAAVSGGLCILIINS